MRKGLLLILLLSLYLCGYSQDSSHSFFDRLVHFPDKVFSKIDKTASKAEQKLNKQTEKYITRLEKQEQKLKRKLWKTDSVKAKALFGDVKGRYDQLRQSLTNKDAASGGNVYSGHLDSLGTMMRFVQNNPLLKEGTALQGKLQSNLGSINQFRQSLNAGDYVRKQVQARQQQLKAELQNTPLAKEFLKFKKEVYYYQQQLLEYKQLADDPEKLGAKLLTLAQKLPAFQKFFREHSELASLFRLPGSSDGMGSMAQFAGLQTRDQLNQILEQRFGTGANVQQMMQQNVSVAQNYMNQLKNKVSQAGGSSSDMELPDFKPNEEKHKSFLKRLEYGSNIQSVRARNYFPATTDFALSVGYKINSKSIIGIGGSYKMGWGTGFNNISVTHQGIGIRSFIDWKLKGSFWISGGYEQNYLAQFRRIEELKDQAIWKQSALLGMSKVVNVKSKFFKKTKVQVLYDFLWRVQVPQTEAVKFRIGYNF